MPASADAAAVVEVPPVNATFDYQIGGAYAPAAGVGIVDRDRHDSPAAGRYSICYVNAFQTQPEEASWWRKHHPSLLAHTKAGKRIEDPDWPGEFLLDTSTVGAPQGARSPSSVGGSTSALPRASRPSSRTTSTPGLARTAC